ncbi:MAG: hypothetical protein LBP39_00260 [Rickettsiales bacterium]|jgi:hypothetical protein|nr:hypothetical protein [Rickettsiales bacterium]
MENENNEQLIYYGPYKEGIKNGRVIVKYENGDVFEGVLKDGKPFYGEMKYNQKKFFQKLATFKGEFTDGELFRGTMKYKNGDFFDGEFRDSKLSHGTMTYANGIVLDGLWKDGQFYYGKKTERDGNVSDGLWNDGQLYYGTKIDSDGIVSNGLWKDGQLYDGKKIYPNGDVFDGFWKNGQLCEGKKTCKDGLFVEEGRWKDSQLCVGKRTYPSGAILEGIWENDQLCVGKKTYLGGYVEEGIWENNQLCVGKKTSAIGNIFEGEWENGQLCVGKETRSNGLRKDGQLYYDKKTERDGNVSDGLWKNGQLYYGKKINPKGIIFDGFWKNGQLYYGKKIDRDNIVFDGFWKNGQLYEGKKTCKDGLFVEEGKWNNGQLCKGRKIYPDGDVLEGEWKNGDFYYGKKIYPDGNVLEGEWKEYQLCVGTRTHPSGVILEGTWENGQLCEGRKTYPTGDVEEGEWKEDQLCVGKKIDPLGNVSEGTWENKESLNVSEKIKLSKTGKSYYSFGIGKNNFQGEAKYCLKDDHGTTKEIIINYEKINEILNKNSSKINSLNDLLENKAIKGVNNFNELKNFARNMLQDKMSGGSGGIEDGFNGSKSPLNDFLLLSSIDTVEQLKKTRFQIHYTKEGEDSLIEDYGSLTNFLKSVGIDNIDNVKEDYLSLQVVTIPPNHAISVILDIKKMKELMKETDKDLDEAVADEKVIHFFDSSRILFTIVDEIYYNMGEMTEMTENCDFINLRQQKLGSCWFQALASTLTAMKYPELVQKIRDEKIELYDTEHESIREGDELNEFQLKQMNTIIEISEKFNIGLTKDDRETIDLIIRDEMKKKIGKTSIPDVARELLGEEIVNQIEKSYGKSGIAPSQPKEIKLSYRIRTIIEGREKINKYGEALKIGRGTIEKLKAKENSILYNEKSVDDSLLVDRKSSKGEEIHTEKSLDSTCKPIGNTLSSFIEREKAKKSSKMERQV